MVAHIGLVKALAHRLAQRLPPQVEIPDLISIGVLGLMDAAGRYRAALGVPFDAFARRRVQGAMLDALRDLDWAPRSLRKMRRELDVALARLRHELRREPTEEEIAATLNMTPAAYGRSLEQLRTLELGAVRPIDDAERGGRGCSISASIRTKGPKCGCSAQSCASTWRAPSRSCRRASGTSWRCTTSRR